MSKFVVASCKFNVFKSYTLGCKLLLACFLFASSCESQNQEIKPADFMERIIDLGKRDRLFDPDDVSQFLGINFVQDLTPPMAQPSGLLFLPKQGTLLSEAEFRYSMNSGPAFQGLEQSASLVFVRLRNFSCVPMSKFAEIMSSQFKKGPGYNPGQIAWTISDHVDRRTALLIPTISDRNGCVATLILSTILK